ncbi:lytic transglycosylase domain-containing protein [Mangrovibacillus sp. Mu-81]|jgi:peptidoglycan LD-endopeptidase LytH|uniref:lytic transglycosylase domain-containing protein n=1 Tax=Mangrovibacillus sp. Mu-81 TaxID=3121478 RepID=UPI002FE4408E
MSPKPKKKKTMKKNKHASLFKILLIPFVILTIYFAANDLPNPNKLSLFGEEEVPPQYIPIYKAAEKEYGVPWNLLAAHHRVETKFSTMKSLISPVGAEGHMQFMPCTFVGWSHPTCGDLGKGDIPEEQKTDPKAIEKYGGYGVDANGDGLADPFQIEDAVFSAANYLAHNGAANGEIEQAVYSYNHSTEYVDDVLYFAERYIEKSTENDNQ